MKDLFVLTADVDAQALMKQVLSRPQALGIRTVDFEVDRHPGRDPGMVKHGPELIRLHSLKEKFQYVLLVWDHIGSGMENHPIQEVESSMTERLDAISWAGRHQVVAVMPELEEWIWHAPDALEKLLNLDPDKLNERIFGYCNTMKASREQILQSQPKELLHHLMRHSTSLRRPPRPGDFEFLAERASLKQWQESPSFARLVETLRRWFPPV